MKRLGRIMIPIVFLSLLVEGPVFATPSTTLWTPATSDVQPFNVWHITYDSYLRLYRTAAECGTGATTGSCNGSGALPGALSTDLGLTVGVLPFEKLNLEVGIDGLFPGTNSSPVLRSIGNSVLFNAKFGIPEGALASWSPALNVGIFDVGTKAQVTDMDIVDFIVGKTLGPFGRLHGGAYIANAGSALMHQNGCLSNSANPTLNCKALGLNDPNAGSLENAGGMVGYDYGFWKVKDEKGNEYNKWTFLADYASGKNFIGGYAVGVGYNFTKDIDILTGPVWFNDHAINGQWKWTVQLDINL
jgi:hypothetical protein